MTSTDKQDFYRLARICRAAASVLSDTKGEQFVLLNLGESHSDEYLFPYFRAGLDQQIGVVGVLQDGTLDFICLPGYERTMRKAAIAFGDERLENIEITQLELLYSLPDMRGQA